MHPFNYFLILLPTFHQNRPIIDAKSLLYPNFIINKITLQIRKDLKGYL